MQRTLLSWFRVTSRGRHRARVRDHARWLRSVEILLAAASIAQASACADSNGALGQSSISPDCAPTDLVCATSGLDAPVAEGSTVMLDVTLTLQGSSAPTIDLVSGNPDVFSVEGQRLRGSRAGVGALLITTPEQVVVDFTHVWVAQPSALLLHRLSEDGVEVTELPGKVELLIGDELSLSVEPYAATQRLLGDLETTWSADEQVVQVLEDGRSSRRRLVALAPGATTLEVEGMGLTTSLDLEVLP
jgi:hypothetical protein